MRLKVLDIFSGIGGFSLGLERTGGFETVAFCEIDKFCQKVLKKHWPDVPIYEDVRTLDHDGSVDVICGGYPCQPFSLAGERKGTEDDRHLWPAMFSLIKKHRPSWVIGENVTGHIGMGLDDVLTDLGSENYAVRTFVIPACAVDAKHRRNRVWIVANRDQRQRERKKEEVCARGNTTDTSCENVAYTDSSREQSIPKERDKQGDGLNNCCETISNTFSERGCCGNPERENAEDVGEQSGSETRRRREFKAWDAEPSVGRVAHGIPQRVDRLKSLGNAVVPQIPEIIGNAILQAEGIEI